MSEILDNYKTNYIICKAQNNENVGPHVQNYLKNFKMEAAEKKPTVSPSEHGRLYNCPDHTPKRMVLRLFNMLLVLNLPTNYNSHSWIFL